VSCQDISFVYFRIHTQAQTWKGRETTQRVMYFSEGRVLRVDKKKTKKKILCTKKSKQQQKKEEKPVAIVHSRR
jgi:hypothetical protein